MQGAGNLFLLTFDKAKNNPMDIDKLGRYVANNTLQEEEACDALRRAVLPQMAQKYSQGYLDHIKHERRRRECRGERLDAEFKEALDFLSDLTHDKA
jgi:hypothetical protein